ncbi:MAG: hypothetical protein LBG52_07650 [Candidatus Peribacteria bacterium]|nr:hypothetical protein [Candidatus Peribacteria bacterium]
MAKSTFADKKSVLLYTSEGNYLILTDGSVSAKTLVQTYGLKGGGNDMLAQGKDENVKKIV